VRDVSWLTVDLKFSSRNGTTDNYGLKAEVLYVSKLGCARIIPTAEQEISGKDKIERSLAKQPAVMSNARWKFMFQGGGQPISGAREPISGPIKDGPQIFPRTPSSPTDTMRVDQMYNCPHSWVSEDNVLMHSDTPDA
jgi:hypothetical protein